MQPTPLVENTPLEGVIFGGTPIPVDQHPEKYTYSLCDGEQYTNPVIQVRRYGKHLAVCSFHGTTAFLSFSFYDGDKWHQLTGITYLDAFRTPEKFRADIIKQLDAYAVIQSVVEAAQ